MDAARRRRWGAYLGSDDLDEPADLILHCPVCAEREFGDV
jgi:hypothetical protein